MSYLTEKINYLNQINRPVKISLGIVLVIISLYLLWPAFHESINQVYTILASGDRQRLYEFVSQFGLWGPIFIILAMVAQMFLIIIPSVALIVVSILAYGPFGGTVIALLAILAASTIGYIIGLWLCPMTVDRLIGSEAKVNMEYQVERYGFWAVVIIRLAPFLSNDAISFVAGLLRMSYWRFIGATTVGILPLIILIAYLGESNERLTTGLLWISGISLVFFVAYVIYDRRRQVS